MLLDLHTHSTASDGQYTPSELVQMAKEHGLEIYAITDHDTISGIAEGRQAADALGVHFVPGIEISSDGGEEVHVVGLGIDENDPVLAAECQAFIESRDNRGEVICEYLNGLGMNVTMKEIKEIAGDANIARPHFAAWLQAHGYVEERKAAFKLYLDTPEFHEATARRLPSVARSIELIHGAGGKAVLAHPGLLKMPLEEQEQLVQRMKAAGLDAIECSYQKHTPEQVELYDSWAKKYDLMISCGSDFHGEQVKKDVPFGMELVKEDQIERLVVR